MKFTYKKEARLLALAVIFFELVALLYTTIMNDPSNIARLTAKIDSSTIFLNPSATVSPVPVKNPASATSTLKLNAGSTVSLKPTGTDRHLACTFDKRDGKKIWGCFIVANPKGSFNMEDQCKTDDDCLAEDKGPSFAPAPFTGTVCETNPRTGLPSCEPGDITKYGVECETADDCVKASHTTCVQYDSGNGICPRPIKCVKVAGLGKDSCKTDNDCMQARWSTALCNVQNTTVTIFNNLNVYGVITK